MKFLLKKTQFIVLGVVITFLTVSILGIGFLFIQAMVLAKMSVTYRELIVCIVMLIFIVNPFLAIGVYFSINKLVGRYMKQDFSSPERMLIKLDIILAQLAGVSMILPSAAVVYREMLGGIVISGIVLGMAVPLVVMLVVVCLKESYPQFRMSSESKKQDTATEENKKMMATLRILAAMMCVLIISGIILGHEILRIPSFDELLQKKINIIEKNMDHVEKIKEYVENLNYEELAVCDEQKVKVKNLSVIYREEKDNGCLILSTQEIMDEIGLKNRNIVDPKGRILVEIDTKTYNIRKISIAIEYGQQGNNIDKPIPSDLAWYNSDYKDRESSWAVLDENWQIEF